MEKKPNLTFFCELPTKGLKDLFSNPQVIKQLQILHANISMGLLDFSTERAAIIRQLTRSGIPVTAWLLLPKEKGYWTSLDTVAETVHCYHSFNDWTQSNKLQWAAIGLDIEPRLDRIQIFSKYWYRHLPEIFYRLTAKQKFTHLENDLRSLVNVIRSDGYAVETYNFPFVIEERNADSRIISKTLGTPPLEPDREVLMLYSSFFGKNGDAVLWSYAHQAEGIGLGSTGGGVALENGEPLKSIRWIDFRRDLLIAKDFTQNIYIFSLEGAVANGYLEPLIDFDWDGTIEVPVKIGKQITYVRKFFTGVLWIFSHPINILASILLIKLLFKKKK